MKAAACRETVKGCAGLNNRIRIQRETSCLIRDTVIGNSRIGIIRAFIRAIVSAGEARPKFLV